MFGFIILFLARVIVSMQCCSSEMRILFTVFVRRLMCLCVSVLITTCLLLESFAWGVPATTLSAEPRKSKLLAPGPRARGGQQQLQQY